MPWTTGRNIQYSKGPIVIFRPRKDADETVVAMLASAQRRGRRNDFDRHAVRRHGLRAAMPDRDAARACGAPDGCIREDIAPGACAGAAHRHPQQKGRRS